MLCPAERHEKQRISDGQRKFSNIFPAERGAALAAINVSHSMVSGCHLTVIRFALNNVNPAHIVR